MTDLDTATRQSQALMPDGKNRLGIDARTVYAREVPDAHVGVLHVNGKPVRELEPGLRSRCA